MSEAVALRQVGPTTIVMVGGVQMVLPPIVVDAGAPAVEHFLEFFAAQLANALAGGLSARLATGASPPIPRPAFAALQPNPPGSGRSSSA